MEGATHGEGLKNVYTRRRFTHVEGLKRVDTNEETYGQTPTVKHPWRVTHRGSYT